MLLHAHCLLAAARAALILRRRWLLRCDSILIRCGGCGEGKVQYGQLFNSGWDSNQKHRERATWRRDWRFAIVTRPRCAREKATKHDPARASLLFVSHHTVVSYCTAL